MFNGSYGLIEILKIGIETVHLIKSNWLYFEKKSIDYEKKTKKSSPMPGIEPGPAGWKAAMLTTTPLYWSDKSKINFMYIRADSALTWSLM